ncbi:hypothetical protein PLICRDRAFT_92113 [Plicaturopsis crispa FD-325 SS-3]|nr:hypothetical protein PLICRDRAFT_92113 [Plicaturopsis crispa FD-325 SS-3]
MTKHNLRSLAPSNGLAAGEKLERNKLAGNNSLAWGWVGTDVTDVSQITVDHRMRTCGFSRKSKRSLCANKYASKRARSSQSRSGPYEDTADGELANDVIEISDSDDGPLCSKKSCKSNPFCLNYLGQDMWEDEDKAWKAFRKAYKFHENPILCAKDPDIPVGLKNLGATCYANAFLQVWFRDLAFRRGVYQCQASPDAMQYEESPIFQLQVTFAALQESTQNVFNPTKLVESLGISTSEQQDAQEFSKLFMSHLDTEFKKQSDPTLQSLIADQFEGKQIYGTICSTCGFKSERMSDFLEIEINFEDNAKLEDRIAALLQPETLTGDNQYYCSQCDCLQDATRYFEFREFPHVLHVSLLRFVYDMASMERKKSKHTITFPSTLDMDHFLGSTAVQSHTNGIKGNNQYELRGVLLHKGSSAYHGHYEAQVYDVIERSWFQFNDEVVTKITSLGNGPGENKDGGKKTVRPRVKAKRRRIDDDSDVEMEAPAKDSGSQEPTFVSSKDAYMLIYARRDAHSQSSMVGSSTNGNASLAPLQPTPPQAPLGVVNTLNAKHDEACESYAELEKEARFRFETLRYRVMDIYRAWSVSERSPSYTVLSRNILEQWLASDAIQAAVSQRMEILDDDGVSLYEGPSTPPPPSPQPPFVSDHICTHGGLDPRKASDMKCVDEVTARSIDEFTACSYPCKSPEEVCEICVADIFKERLYQIQHPQTVARFDEVNTVEEGSPGYWISKEWLKDWRLAKPKMHKPSEPDDPPPHVWDDILCDHGGLSHNLTIRRRISPEACRILKELFPSWNPVPTDTELCAVCDAVIFTSKEGSRDLRRKAEMEKASLKHMHDNALLGTTAKLRDVPCAIIPASFVRAWRSWLLRPAVNARPERVDTSIYMCEHEHLILDPNCEEDWDSGAQAVAVKLSDWHLLSESYPVGPLIFIERKSIEDTSGASRLQYAVDIPVCADCRLARRRDFTTANITLRISNAKDPFPTDDTAEIEELSDVKPKPIHQYGKRAGGVRQSKRIRENKRQSRRKCMSIQKGTSIKDIKLFVQAQCDIATICQRVFYRGKELEDNSATVESIGILADDLVDIREEQEVDEIPSDIDDGPPIKKKREEEKGFGGTVLGGAKIQTQKEKSCRVCTLVNPVAALTCEACDAQFLA